MNDYRILQETLDSLIGTVGLENTIYLLKKFANQIENPVPAEGRAARVASCVVGSVITSFGLEPAELATSNVRDYREGRMAAYHLLKRFADHSYGRSAEFFGVSRRSVLYYHNRCEELLSAPKIYREFHARYQEAEKRIIDFMATEAT